MLVLILFSLLFIKTQSLSCTSQFHCNSVTTNHNYVSCVSGLCQCLTALGFDGNASVASQCRCDAPSSVYYQASTPYCFRYSDAAACKVEVAKQVYQKTVIEAVYESLVWPTPAIIMGALIQGQPSLIGSFFAGDAKGRVDPVGKFTGHDGVVEYFYGTVWTGASRVVKKTFKKLLSNDNIVSFSVVLTFENWQGDVKVGGYDLAQSGTFTFNVNGLIQSMDLIIHNLGVSINPPIVKTPESIGTICYLILNIAGCNATHDPNGYYTSPEDCYNYIGNIFPWGTWDDLFFNGNSSNCRYFHALLAIARPQVHCSHAGKTGGMKCVDHPYAGYFLEDF